MFFQKKHYHSLNDSISYNFIFFCWNMAWNIKLLSQKYFSKKKKHDLCLVCRSNLLYKHQYSIKIKMIEFILILIFIWNVVSLLFVAHNNNNVAQLFCQLLSSLFSKHWAGNNWNRFGKWNSWRNSLFYWQHSNWLQIKQVKWAEVGDCETLRRNLDQSDANHKSQQQQQQYE